MFQLQVLTTLIACQLLFTSSLATGASITGDEFTATVFEGGSEVGSASGTAGAAGDDVSPATDVVVEWLDEDTFELDFFGYSDIKVTLSGLDFMNAGSPVAITGIVEADAAFGWSYVSSFDANSITIDYPSLSGNAIGDGEIISFDVLTIPEPGSLALCCSAVVLLCCQGRVRRR